jgi:hypothetical protein
MAGMEVGWNTWEGRGGEMVDDELIYQQFMLACVLGNRFGGGQTAYSKGDRAN